MWTVRNHRIQLPSGFSLDEDEDTLLLRCLWCGWEAVYYCHRAAPSRVEVDAFVHRADCRCAVVGA